MKQLTSIEVNGKSVTFFEPPHPEPDFPWVDTMQLASAFLPLDPAKDMLKSTQRFEDGKTVVTIRDGDRLTTIMCHAMAQGLCGAIDSINGDSEEDGPIFMAYCRVAAKVAKEHWPLGLVGMVEAFHNLGGPFLRNEGGEK